MTSKTSDLRGHQNQRTIEARHGTTNGISRLETDQIGRLAISLKTYSLHSMLILATIKIKCHLQVTQVSVKTSTNSKSYSQEAIVASRELERQEYLLQNN